MTQDPCPGARRVLLVDDHPMFTQALAAVLADRPGLEVVAQVRTVSAATAEVALSSPDLVLLNVQVDSGRGEDLMRQLVAGRGGSHRPLVAVLTECEDPVVVARGLVAGVVAWMSKSQPLADVVQAVAGLQAGDCYLPPWLLGPSIRALVTGLQPPPVAAPLTSLTAREREVLQCLVDGDTRGEAAARLYCSQNTVRTHTQHVLAKLGVHSAVEAVATAMRLGMRPRHPA